MTVITTYELAAPIGDRHDQYEGAVILREDVFGGIDIEVLVPAAVAADPVRRQRLIDWAWERAERFAEGGPELDGGWKHAADGSWQTWARVVSLPDF